jgi:glycine betaine/proline transport system permease protein
MYEWITEHKLTLGAWLKDFVDFLTDNGRPFFDFVSLVLGGLIDGLTEILLWVPPLVLIAAVAIFAWLLHRSIALVIFVLLSLLLIANLGYWEAAIQTLSLVFCSTIVCVVVGVPVGIMAAHRPWLYVTLRPILD